MHHSGDVLVKRQFDEGDLRRQEWFGEGGKPSRFSNYQNGVLHGPSWELTNRIEQQGSLRHGKRTGVWEVRYRPDDEWYTASQAFAEGLPQGEWVWKDAAGTVLQTACFERGELVTWNGQPVSGNLEEWFARNYVI